MKLKIGVMGSSAKPKDKSIIKRAQEVGKEIAKHGCIFLNGATTGMPGEAAKGAKAQGGFVLGISPAKNLHEHIHQWKLPHKEYDTIIFTDIGFNYRNILNIRSSDAVIFIRGSMGTLNEFTIAYEEGKVIGVLDHTGGISSFFDQIIEICKKQSGAIIIHETDPKILVDKLIKQIKKRHGR